MENDLNRLISAARRRTGLFDLGEVDALTGLEVLVRSAANDTRLSTAGRVSLRQLIVSILSNRLQLVRAQQEKPELADQPLSSPLIITGLPRSGTTLMHRMLAADHEHYAPPLWETMYPLRPVGRFDSRRARCQLGLVARKVLLKDLDRIHHVTADAAEEDLFVLGSTFESWLFWGAAPVHSYMDWYLRQDHAAKYRLYRLWLQVFQAAHPGRRLVLKAPEHAGGVSALMTVIPEARVIQLHRDPVTVFSSYVSLVRTTQSLSVKETDRAYDARATLKFLAADMDRNVEAREKHPGSIVDVFYKDLIADPDAVAQRVYRECGLTRTGAAAAAMQRYIAENPQGKHGAHNYSLSDTGVEEKAVRSHFATYSDRFGFAV